MATLPDRSWKSYEDVLRRLGERRPDRVDGRALAFLAEIGMLSANHTDLDQHGSEYFNAQFVLGDEGTARSVLANALRSWAPGTAIRQLLWGVSGADKARAETVLRNQGFGAGLSDRALGTILTLLDYAGLISYANRTGAMKVLDGPPNVASPMPKSAFISSTTPFGNKVWLGRVFADCNGSVRWLDKHFMPVAFESIWEHADAQKLSSVKILSLRMADHEGRRPIRQYRDLRTELGNRGISLEWRTIDCKLVRDTHDRWIIGESQAWNVPNTNAIYTGQNSELHRTEDHVTLTRLFEGYWAQANEFDPPTTT